jgi:hypothetical protein
MTPDHGERELLIQKLRWLRLPGMARLAHEILDEAAKTNLTHFEVMHRFCDEEKKSRLDSAVKRRIQDARFPQINTIDGFDFDFDACRKKLKSKYLALLDLTFLDQPFQGGKH